MRTTGTAGTTTWELGGAAAGGDPGRLYLWNCYNRAQSYAQVQDSTSSWTYVTATWRPWDGAASNTNARVEFVHGLNEDSVTGVFGLTHYGGGTVDASAGINLDSTTATPTMVAYLPNNPGALSNTAHYKAVPGLGFHYLQAMEYSGGATSTFYGNNSVTLKPALSVWGMF
jgi:hypothetical protein